MNTIARTPRFRPLLALPAALLLALASTSALAAEPLPSPVDEALAPDKFEWTPEASNSGPVTVLVSIPAQEVHVYRGAVRIGRATVSTGRPGYDTPVGTFEILEKYRLHHSNKYDNAPMPFMQRLTWDGVALHAGAIPGYPASHGCVRLPKAFAEKLFEVTERGGRVIVADASTASEAVLYPGARIPVDPWTGLEPGAENVATTASVSTNNAAAVTPATTVVTASASARPLPATASPALAGN